MNYRLAKILARKNYTADHVEPIDIKLVDPVSQMVVVYEVLGAGGIDLVGHPAKCIPKIELIDGSDVLYSLSGVGAQAVDFYHNKKEPANRLTYLNGNYSCQVYQLNFGRYLYDPLLAWDPKRFVNPQMKISIDINASELLVLSGRLTVMAHIFDEKVISPVGFLMNKEIKSWNVEDGGHEYTGLPLDFPYRKLFLRAQEYDSSPLDQVDNIKLTEDNDKRIPIDNTSSEIVRAIIGQTPNYRENLTFPAYVDLRMRYVTPTYNALYGAMGWTAHVGMGVISGFGGAGGRINVICTATSGNVQAAGEGYLPHGVFEIPFGNQDDPDDWYDVTKLGSLKADITGGADTGTAELMLQQLRTY